MTQVVLVAIVLSGLCILFFYPRDRAVFIEADTAVSSIEIGNANRNYLTLPQGTLEIDGEYIPFDEGKTLNILEGTTVTLRHSRSTKLFSILLERSDELETGSLDRKALFSDAKVIFAPKHMEAFEPFELFGTVTVGAVAQSSSPDYLVHGSYTFWERDFITGITQVLHGKMNPGTVVRIMGEKTEQLDTRMLVEPLSLSSQNFKNTPVMRVVIDAGFGTPMVELERTGLGDRTYVWPSWTDRAISNPMVLGVSTFLGLFLLSIQIVALFLRRNE